MNKMKDLLNKIIQIDWMRFIMFGIVAGSVIFLMLISIIGIIRFPLEALVSMLIVIGLGFLVDKIIK